MTDHQKAVFGGVPAWLLADYLVDLGGDRIGDDHVAGEGWAATVEPHARPPGSVSIGRVTVTIEGREAGQIMERLREKAQRGGG